MVISGFEEPQILSRPDSSQTADYIADCIAGCIAGFIAGFIVKHRAARSSAPRALDSVPNAGLLAGGGDPAIHQKGKG